MATQGEREVLVISVQKHKTDIQRPVNVMFQGKFSGHTSTKYALSVTPRNQCNYFLVVQGGRQVMNPNYMHTETQTQIQTRCTNGHSSLENWVHCNSESLQCYRSDITGYTYGQYSTNTAKIASGHNRKAAFSHCKPAA